MTDHEAAIKAFCDQFEPALRYGKTDAINGAKTHDAYVVSISTPFQVLITAYEGRLRTYIGVGEDLVELRTSLKRAADLGACIANAVQDDNTAAALAIAVGALNAPPT